MGREMVKDILIIQEMTSYIMVIGYVFTGGRRLHDINPPALRWSYANADMIGA